MRITSWNILHGQSLQAGATADAAQKVAALESDLVALQEVDYRLDRSQSSRQIADIAAAMGSNFWGFAPAIHGTPGESWRILKKSEQRVFTADDIDDQNGYYGIAIASKVAVSQWYRLELGRSWIGMPLLVSNENGKPRFLYVKDEPRVALAAVLENGWTVINTHLSFVPLVNIAQLFKISRWARKMEKLHQTKVILLGDFNLPWGIPSRLTSWNRATQELSYPSWKPAISFDYILARAESIPLMREAQLPAQEISDHRPIAIDIFE